MHIYTVIFCVGTPLVNPNTDNLLLLLLSFLPPTPCPLPPAPSLQVPHLFQMLSPLLPHVLLPRLAVILQWAPLPRQVVSLLHLALQLLHCFTVCVLCVGA